MMRKLSAGLVLMGFLMASAPAWAGGWSVLTLDAWPGSVPANKPVTIGFTVRQHGHTLLSGLDGSVIFERVGEPALQFPIHAAGATGHYTATFMLPKTGVWQWRIDAFGEHKMPALTVIATARSASVRSLSPAQQTALGKTLFMAKGCSQCHYHEGVEDSGKFTNAYGAGNAPNLTRPKFTSEYLHLWLKSPQAVKMGTEMPNLNLKPAEIDALVAFLSRLP